MFWKKKKPEAGVGNISERYDLIDSLQTLVDKHGLDGSMLSVAVEVDEAKKTLVINTRSPVFVFDGETPAEWKVDSLRSLFRGDEQAPPNDALSRYPAEFTPLFYEIERNLSLIVPEGGLPPTDSECLEIYSAMRRRPDGRSLGQLHDFVWMNAALMLGKYRCSESLYAAIMNRLERSVRTFKMGSSSRNYMNYIGSHF